MFAGLLVIGPPNAEAYHARYGVLPGVPDEGVGAGAAHALNLGLAPAQLPAAANTAGKAAPTPAAPTASGMELTVANSAPPEFPASAPPSASMPAAPSVPAIKVPDKVGFVATTSVEVVAEREQFAKVYANADGTRTVRAATVPLHFQDAAGNWVDVDDRIRRDGKALVNAANDWQVRFESMADGGVTFVAADGTVSFSAVGGSNKPPMIEPDGVSVRYKNALKGVDLVYRVNGAGIEEFIEIRDKAAVTSVDFELRGVTLGEVDGGYAGMEQAGLPSRVRVSAPDTYDRRGRPVDPAKHRVKLAKRGDAAAAGIGSVLSIGLDPEWVAQQPDDAFPLVIDPSMTVVQADMATSIAADITTGAPYATLYDGYARVGNPAIAGKSNVRWRSVIRFPYSGWFASKPSIIAADLITNVWGGGDSGTQHLKVWWASSYDFVQLPYRYTDATLTGAQMQDWQWPYATGQLSTGQTTHTGGMLGALYNRWVKQGVDGGTFLLTGNEGTAYSLKKFTVQMQVTYNYAPNKPAISAAAVGRSLTVNVTPQGDPDGDTVYYAYSYSSPSRTVTTDWTTATTWTIPTSIDDVGVGYTQVVAADHVYNPWEANWHSTASDLATVTVPNQPPPAPQPLSPADGYDDNLQPTLSVGATTDPDGDVVRYQFCFAEPGVAWECSSLLTSPTWQIPAGKLKWMTGYSWVAFAFDNRNWSAASTQRFVMPAITPATRPSLMTGFNPYSASAGGIDIANGNFRTSATDIDIPTVGTDLAIARAYNSQNLSVGAFGLGWTFPLDLSVREVNANDPSRAGLIVRLPDGAESFHGRNPDGSYATAVGSANRVLRSPIQGVGWQMIEGSGTTYDFDANGQLLRAADPLGRQVTSSWNDATTQVFTDVASGRSLTLTYSTPVSATRPHISSVATSVVAAHAKALVWKYYYEGDKLRSVCDPRNNAQGGSCLTYDYTGTLLSKLTLPKGNVSFEVGYDTSVVPPRANSRKDALGNSFNVTYSAAAPLQNPDGAALTADLAQVTNPRGNAVWFYFDSLLAA